ncbi:MAG: nucleotidyl transferase AbiEii/AbiGii toxin family protein [Verrucomicrobiota bacterium]
MRAVFELLLRIQAASGLRFLLIGGWALQAYGYARQTVDVDCMTATQDEARVSVELNNAGFEPFDRLSAFVRYRHRVNPLMVLDLMMVDAGTFEKMWLEAQSFKVADFSLRVPSLEHLIALKLHAAKNPHRASRDLSDVIELLSMNRSKVSPESLQELCDKFGSPEAAQKLRSFL